MHAPQIIAAVILGLAVMSATTTFIKSEDGKDAYTMQLLSLFAWFVLLAWGGFWS